MVGIVMMLTRISASKTLASTHLLNLEALTLGRVEEASALGVARRRAALEPAWILFVIAIPAGLVSGRKLT
jgi:hypothetical protein